MPVSASAVRQERFKKTGTRPNLPGLFTINEEDEQQRNGHVRKQKAGDAQAKLDEKKAQASSCPPSATSGQNNNTGNKQESLVLKVDERQRLARERREEREKQLAARESAFLEREERAKQYYEKHLEERKKKLEEQRIKEEKRRAAVEEKRRLRLEEEKERHEAVVRRTIERSQKAKQKPNRWSWGGAMHSSTVNTTGFVESAFLFLDLAGLEHHFQGACGFRRYGTKMQYADRRSVSTMNLSKHVDPVMSKRLSSSSATLLNTPDRALQKRSSYLIKLQSKPRSSSRGKPSQDAQPGVPVERKSRRMQLSPWESNIVSRLLTPTHSYLARSRSTVSLSGETVIPICPRSASFSPMTPASYKPTHCRSVERPRAIFSSSEATSRRRTVHSVTIDKKEKDKENEQEKKGLSNLTAPPAISTARRSRSPSHVSSRAKAPSPARVPHKTPPLPGTPKQLKSPSQSAEDLPAHSHPLSPGNVRPVRTKTNRGEEDEHLDVREESTEDKQPSSKPSDSSDPSAPKPEPLKESVPVLPQPQTQAPASLPPQPAAATAKPSAGTTDPEEATRLLAEKRRQAREQREREEEERKQREEAERRGREEMARRKAEEKARREEEARLQGEERKRREEEEKRAAEEKQQKLAEERAQKDSEEAERLQKQKEEEEARLREEDERVRLERERKFQKEEQERLERKKRLEEIMKRTRRSDGADKKPVSQRNGEVSQQTKTEETVPSQLSKQTPQSVKIEPKSHEEPAAQYTGSNGHGQLSISDPPPAAEESTSTVEKRPKENGISVQNDSFEEVINLPVGTKTSKLSLTGEGSQDGSALIPVLAFKENGSLGSLANVDGVQSHQTAEVV
ncbi:ensconsin isoform X1 [Acipenser oxyrinchus oxyrinchus]|uniref:Ensconsin isoform X1 n=1 Tax=Acipenser oxyrinchus oxyrinchus TaxID=40147 RepID=A0AAD8GAI1_ACIOX|nr:ensconsin isoform X1 [Acipenser oxyrinchus oxyrinchus]